MSTANRCNNDLGTGAPALKISRILLQSASLRVGAVSNTLINAAGEAHNSVPPQLATLSFSAAYVSELGLPGFMRGRTEAIPRAGPKTAHGENAAMITSREEIVYCDCKAVTVRAMWLREY